MYGKTQKLDYREGSIIVYSPFGGGKRRVLVDEKDSDIKNGRPGFAGHQVDADGNRIGGEDEGCWGYDDQIVRVVKR